jgi:hypothetical protein
VNECLCKRPSVTNQGVFGSKLNNKIEGNSMICLRGLHMVV